MGFLAQGLLRKPVSRGGKQGRAEVASRFACVQQGDWAGLVERWERDKIKRTSQLAKMRRDREGEEREAREQRETNRLRREVVSLIESGHLGKAMGRVTSFGLGDTADPSVRQQLETKFPHRSRPLPPSVKKTKPIEKFRSLRDSFLALDPGIAPGSGGLRNEYLVALGERMTDEEILLMEEFGLAYTSGDLPEWFYVVWLSLQTVAPFKTGERDAVRPLGLRNSLTKTFHKEVVIQSR